MNFLLSIKLFFFISALSVFLSLAVKKIASHFNLLDRPDGRRKIQSAPVPLAGGAAVFIAFGVGLFLGWPLLISGNLESSHWLAFLTGALLLILGGVLDDRYNLPPRYQFLFPLVAAIFPVLGGVSIEKLSNPLGGELFMPAVVSAALIISWLLGMMYTTKLLDGVDGLVSGLGVIGAAVIFLFTSTTRYAQPDIAFAALMFAAACAGFLILNYNPAKIYLGEGGSLLIGYVLGVLAVISGGKIAIALLIMGLPILDVVWTILRRLAKGKNPFRFADRRHLHHRLLDLGLSPKQTVAVFYGFASFFGLSGLFLQSRGKLLALFALLMIMLAAVIFFSLWERRRRPSLLFHICCAPCASYSTLKLLLPHYRVSWYFHNPNLSSREEYERRLQAASRAARILGVKMLAAPYLHQEWRDEVRGRELDRERGERCRICYRFRLASAHALASRGNFDFFSTSLLVSPYKDGRAIREIAEELSAAGGPRFLDLDFQADDNFRLSLVWAKEKGIYLQNYCGCEFSFRSKKKKI